MCERCEDVLVALEAVDANLGTLILARRTLTDRLSTLEGNHAQQAPQAATEAHTAACDHGPDDRITMNTYDICNGCGCVKEHGSDKWVLQE